MFNVTNVPATDVKAGDFIVDILTRGSVRFDMVIAIDAPFAGTVTIRHLIVKSVLIFSDNDKRFIEDEEFDVLSCDESVRVIR